MGIHLPIQPNDTALENISEPVQRVLSALQNPATTMFKLIGGGSLTDSDSLTLLTEYYTLAGVDMIDIAPDYQLIEAVSHQIKSTLATNSANHLARPAIMISVPLDPDPHFRKIDLNPPDCILCEACIPVCPTSAITMTPDNLSLDITQTLCYGCNRCVPVCPTDALTLHPFLLEKDLHAVLSHPNVDALEIHSAHMDPLMMSDFVNTYRDNIKNKLIAVCFRPETLPSVSQWLESLAVLQKAVLLPLILQIDGKPMSGGDAHDASVPALESVVHTVAQLRQHFNLDTPSPLPYYITISGGINHITAELLQDPKYKDVQGVGMGTYARKALWDTSHKSTEKTDEKQMRKNTFKFARDLVDRFHRASITEKVLQIS